MYDRFILDGLITVLSYRRYGILRKTAAELMSDLERQQREKPKRVMRSFYVDKDMWESFKALCVKSNLSQGDVFSTLIKAVVAEGDSNVG
jgi:hypothetical protein